MLKDLNGKNVSLSQFKGKTLFIQVWSTWCGVCMAELPSSQQLWNSLRDHDEIAFLFVNIDDEVNIVNKFMNKRGFDFPAFLRVERSKEFKDDKLPSTFIVDQKGMILLRHFGSAEWDDPSVREYLFSHSGE